MKKTWQYEGSTRLLVRNVMGCLRSVFQGDKDIGPLILPAFRVLQSLPGGEERQRLVAGPCEIGAGEVPASPPSSASHSKELFSSCGPACQTDSKSNVDVVPFACLLLSTGGTHASSDIPQCQCSFIAPLKAGRDEWQLKMTSENSCVTQRCCEV